MTKRLGVSLLVLVGLFVLVGVVGVPVHPVQAQAGKTPVVWPAGDIKWSDNPAIPGARITVLWGDPKTGAYGSIKKIPGGNKLALHTHTHDQRIVTISGAIVVAIDGASPKEMGPGSYAFIPAGVKHTADCKAGAECSYFEEQPGASDIKFVDAAKPSN